MNARIDLPYSKPPLSMNDRKHYHAKARIIAKLRKEARLLAKAASVPTGLANPSVTLHYQPRDNRRRDADNLVPILKACCDGLVDHGITTDDTPDLMTKHMPVIHQATKGTPAALWLEIEWANP
ncbi:RusA family crossover junction endodeoxyribonuclease [Rhodococcus globerulus]|uniref:Uncharacterized protein n=1 Tax=Rhodococcus globerulus TaxID=33008 RepID=A0ABU4C4E5_RHOGO|nr:hypothetical protein [Rhodococcus globerulus]MDV6271088.1 hypothetical protein [Rhodococcus globerulus]